MLEHQTNQVDFLAAYQAHLSSVSASTFNVNPFVAKASSPSNFSSSQRLGPLKSQ